MSNVVEFEKKEKTLGFTVFEPIEIMVENKKQILDCRELIQFMLANSAQATKGILNIREGIKFIDTLVGAKVGDFVHVPANVGNWIFEGFNAIQWRGAVCMRKEFEPILDLVENIKNQEHTD